jgi:hypothetical protein
MKLPEMIITHEARRRCPEERVLLAVINLAALDAMERPLGKHPNQELTENARSALRFLLGSGFRAYCNALGFDPKYMLNKLECMIQDRETWTARLSEEHWRSLRCNLWLWRQGQYRSSRQKRDKAKDEKTLEVSDVNEENSRLRGKKRGHIGNF